MRNKQGGPVVVITGASDGIGRGIALEYAKRKSRYPLFLVFSSLPPYPPPSLLFFSPIITQQALLLFAILLLIPLSPL